MAFVGEDDHYLLRNGKVGVGNWDLIGQDGSHSLGALKIEDYMTYDEVKLAALLQVSSFVRPINNGSRFNRGMHMNSHRIYEQIE